MSDDREPAAPPAPPAASATQTPGPVAGAERVVPPVLLHPAATHRHRPRPLPGHTIPETGGREAPEGSPRPVAAPVPLRPAAAAETASAAAARAGDAPVTNAGVLVPLRRATAVQDRAWGFIPCGYGWALAWTLGLGAMGLYLLPAVQSADVARVYIGNPQLSAAGGAAIGLMGAAFMIQALIRHRIGLTVPQALLIAVAWVLGGGGGLLAAAWLSLPVIGVAAGLVGFELGWVLCWLIAASVGSLGTWLALRPSHPGLDQRDLGFTAAGFALGALGGWLLGWVLVAIPILPLWWLLDWLLPGDEYRDRVMIGLQVLSLSLTGLLGGAAYGLGGGAVLLGSLTRGGARTPGDGRRSDRN